MNYRWNSFKWAVRRWWYHARYDIHIGYHGSMLPELGGHAFCSVTRKGNFIDIVWRHTGEVIRLIPYHPNHGVMVEYHHSLGVVGGRTHCDFQKFKEMVSIMGESQANSKLTP